MRLRSTIPAVAATALLAAVLASPAQAVAATGTTPTQVTTPTPGLPFASSFQQYAYNSAQLGVWDIGADGSYNVGGISQVSLHFRLHGDAAGAPDDAVIGGLTQESPSDPVWDGKGLIKLPQLGTYDVSAEVVDQAGHDVIVPNVGEFTYSDSVVVSNLQASPTTVDFDHRTVTVTGQATITDPRTGTTVAPDHLQVSLNSSGSVGGLIADVNADGTFTATGTVETGTTLTFSAGGVRSLGTTPYQLGYSPGSSNAVNVVREPTRIRLLEPADVYVKSGPVTLKGIVERLDGNTWVPAPNIGLGYTSAFTQYFLDAGADGTFSTDVSTAGMYTFTTSGDTNNLLYGQGVFLSGSTSNTVHVHIPAPTYFNYESYSEDANGVGQFTFGLYTNGSTIPDNSQYVYVDWSPDGNTWHVLGTTRIGRPGVASNTVQFWATAANNNANGYWKLYYPGTADQAPAFSSPVHLYRVVTAITGGRPSTTHAYNGQTVRFTGTLWQHRDSWLRMHGCQLALVFRPAGSKTWYYVTGVRTNRYGNFSISTRDRRSGTWAVVYITPDQTHLDVVGPMTYVRVG